MRRAHVVPRPRPCPRPGLVPVLSLAALAALVSTSAGAQFAQYTPPAGVSVERELGKELFEQSAADARWRLGPVRVDPWFAVRDVGLVEQPDAETDGSRLSATAGAGVRLYLPTGSKLMWAAHVLPEYIYVDAEGESRLNGRYGLGLFGFFNRLTVHATAQRQQALDIITPEVLQRVNTRSDRLALNAEVRLLRTLHLHASTQQAALESLVEADDPASLRSFADLDRDETVSRAGLRLRLRSGWVVGTGAEWSEVEFAPGATERSNSGVSPYFEIANREGKLKVALDLALRSLEPEGDAPFVPFDGLTGSISLTYGREGSRLTPGASFTRGVVYTLDSQSSYFESTRYGLSFALKIGTRSSLSAFATTGTDDFVGLVPGPGRSDDQLGIGASFQVQIGRRLGLSLGGLREEYSSSLPGSDRELTVLRAGVTFGSDRSPWL